MNTYVAALQIQGHWTIAYSLESGTEGQASKSGEQWIPDGVVSTPPGAYAQTYVWLRLDQAQLDAFIKHSKTDVF